MTDKTRTAPRRRIKLVAMLLFAAMGATAQQPDTNAARPSATLTSQLLDNDFVNFFAFGNGSYDTHLPLLRGGQSYYGGTFGYDLGGGVTASHTFRDGDFSLSYRGDYRTYEHSSYGSGTTQNLSVIYDKRLNRRWSISLNASGGILTYGGSFYSSVPTAASTDITNPLSTHSRFASAGGSLIYSQSKRLSYVFSGSFFYSNYNYGGAANSLGGTGSASVQYRTTARTTIGGSYSHSYYTYGSSFGTSIIDGGYLTYAHTFTSRWSMSASAGLTHSHSKGTITLPVTLLLDQQYVSGYVTGPYNRTYNTPSFQVGINHNLKRSSVSLSAGQGVNGGNGTYLTSKDQFVTLTFSASRRKSNFSLAGSYFRLTSISNSVSQVFSTANFSASYGYTLHKYLAVNVRYDYIHYDHLFNYGDLNESRISIGLSFSSKSVPLTLF